MTRQTAPRSPGRHRVALMQPYFLPYLGYFQLIAAADHFVLYDNVQFIKNGWIERNRYLLDGEAKWFRIALAKASHTQHIMQRRIAEQFELADLLNKLDFAYRKAPRRAPVMAWLEALLTPPADSIATLDERLLKACCTLLGIDTPISRASALPITGEASSQERVIQIVQACGATHYLNPIGGGHLYQAEAFQQAGITLELLGATLPPYSQGSDSQPFVAGLSILDALMFQEPEVVGAWARLGEIQSA
ncbi:WbqC family protein [Pseudomonas asiatica]|uniref:WbqC family protein n=1 Tax=Pseudomonas TaxID=286 RepID=UPI00159492CD|nr:MULTISPECIES: WbqC family protein [Pseudomonas]